MTPSGVRRRAAYSACRHGYRQPLQCEVLRRRDLRREAVPSGDGFLRLRCRRAGSWGARIRGEVRLGTETAEEPVAARAARARSASLLLAGSADHAHGELRFEVLRVSPKLVGECGGTVSLLPPKRGKAAALVVEVAPRLVAKEVRERAGVALKGADDRPSRLPPQIQLDPRINRGRGLGDPAHAGATMAMKRRVPALQEPPLRFPRGR